LIQAIRLLFTHGIENENDLLQSSVTAMADPLKTLRRTVDYSSRSQAAPDQELQQSLNLLSIIYTVHSLYSSLIMSEELSAVTMAEAVLAEEPSGLSKSLLSAPDYDEREEQTGRRVFVKGDDTAQSASRKISMAALPDSKQGFPVRVMAKRAGAVNVAVKALAIATKRLESEATTPMHIVAVPFFRDNRNEVSLYVEDLEKLKANALLTTDMAHYPVGTKTDPKLTAGAIASSAREGHASSVQGIGADAVFNAIRAIAIAREYLRDKDDKVDLFCKAEFIEVTLDTKDGETRDSTAVKITAFLHQGIIDM
jgi:stage V sporulation protein S